MPGPPETVPPSEPRRQGVGASSTNWGSHCGTPGRVDSQEHRYLRKGLEQEQVQCLTVVDPCSCLPVETCPAPVPDTTPCHAPVPSVTTSHRPTSGTRPTAVSSTPCRPRGRTVARSTTSGGSPRPGREGPSPAPPRSTSRTPPLLPLSVRPPGCLRVSTTVCPCTTHESSATVTSPVDRVTDSL